jgi:Tfp pilus assembly protein PilO
MLTITKTQSVPATPPAPKSGLKIPPWLATAVGCLLVSGLAYAFIVSPQWKRVGAGRELDVAAAQNDTAARERYLDQLQDLQENYQAIDQASIDLLARMLPRGKGAPELLHQIEAMARSSGVNLTNINIAEVQEDVRRGTAAQRAAAQQKKSEVKQLLIQVQVTAYDYPSFRSFLEAIQSHTRILDVENFVFTTEKEIQQLTLKAYYIE